MLEEIVSQLDFERKVKQARGNQLLLFYGDNSDLSMVIRYSTIAQSLARELQKPIKVCKINLDHVQLLTEDMQSYQRENLVICCTTVKDAEIKEKQINPFEIELHQMVRNILA